MYMYVYIYIYMYVCIYVHTIATIWLYITPAAACHKIRPAPLSVHRPPLPAGTGATLSGQVLSAANPENPIPLN